MVCTLMCTLLIPGALLASAGRASESPAPKFRWTSATFGPISWWVTNSAGIRRLG